jgi:outer membrane protein OmpA-like peptidoglycan-associated protein
MRVWIGLLLVAAAPACSKAVEFQGKSTLAVVGSPPAAPPPVAPPRVVVRDNKIEIHEKIQFDYDKSTIKDASSGLMREIADVIVKNPHIKRIQIEGHASSEGSATHNKALSDSRARAVMDWLTANGVAANRLTAIGFGVERPIADNATEAGRETNRRVEFAIVEQDVTKRTVEVDASGAEKVVDEKMEKLGATPAAANNTPKRPPAAKGVTL